MEDSNNLVALKSGYYFMIFKKEEIPFFYELEKTNKAIIKDNKKYNLYEAPNWDIAQKVDALMDKKNEIGYEIDNYLNNDFKKVNAPIIGSDGNVFNLIGICTKALKKAGYNAMADELTNRVTHSHSYEDALSIMAEYVNPVDQYNNSLDDINYDDVDISI